MNENLGNLQTEGRNTRTLEIDQVSTLDACRLLNAEDQLVAEAVKAVLPNIAAGVDMIADAFRAGHRLFYTGAGTSGRIGSLDASECPPTFGVPRDQVTAVIAGGPKALTDSSEGAEDDPKRGASDLVEAGVSAGDVVVGSTASGRTPYVLGALDKAREIGARTIGISNCDPAAISKHCELSILVVTGPEAIQGSTRLKAGTAQKMVLNMLSTLSMVRIGKTYGNLMIDVNPLSVKLRDRARRILVTATGCSPEDAAMALQASGCRVKVATVMLLTGLDPATAAQRLEESGGFVAKAIGKV